MNREILRLAIPNIISNISVPLLSTVDTALMGRLSELHIGAVGVGAMIFNFIYWNFGFLRMGTTGLTAQAFGEENRADIILTFVRALLVAGTLAAILLLTQYAVDPLARQLMNVGGEQGDLVKEYFLIRIWAAPASLGLFALMGWFFGMQNAVFPLILTVSINVVNIIASYYFVAVLQWEVAGVAWGTVIAQYLGIILGFILFFIRYRSYWNDLILPAILAWEELRRFLVLNMDIFLRTLCLTFVFAFFYSQSAKDGALVLAVNTILMQFLNWMSYGVDGFAFAAESLVGKYKGKKDESGTLRAIRLSFIWGMVFAVFFSALYALGGTQIMSLFTDQENVLQAGLPYLWWMILLPIISTPCYIWDGIYIGLTASKSMRNAMVLTLIIFVIAYFSTTSLGNHGLWLSLLIFMGARGLIQWGFFARFGLALR